MSSIAIIGGTGALGAALAVRLAGAGHSVRIGSRDAAKAQAAADRLSEGHKGLRLRGDSIEAAAAEAEICVLAVPYAAHAETLGQIKPLVAGKIVIDATVPLRPPKVGTVQLPPAGAAAVETQLALGPEAKVVSALQTIGAEKLASGQAVDGDVLVASDDAEAAAGVCALLGEIGLRAWHVGPLANSAAAEAMTSVLIQINRRYKRVQAGLRITGKPRDSADGAPRRSGGVSVTPLVGLPMFETGDDLAGAVADAIIAAGLAPEDGDVVVVAQKAVSKVEGRAVALSSVEVTERGRALAAETGKPEPLAELIAAESAEILRVRPGLVITRHRLGPVAANAGIDQSNISADAGERALLWPLSPDESAARLRASLQDRFGVRLAVIVSDSLGRAWRMGTTGTAIGVAGMAPVRDRRGEKDLFGRILQATLVAVADEIAAAASLVIGEADEAVPAALVRGAVYTASEAAGAGELLRPLDQDLFR